MKERAPLLIREIIKKIGAAEPAVSIEELVGQTIFQVSVDDSRRLIGVRGDTLRALEYLVRKLLEKQGVEANTFTLDIDGYKSRQIKDLQQKAMMMAERAKSFQYDVELTPMSSYERLIVHAALTDVPNIKTESRGEGKERRVVIRYAR